MTNLPKYLKEILKMNVQANAIGTALPFLGNVIVTVGNTSNIFTPRHHFDKFLYTGSYILFRLFNWINIGVGLLN